ncbi:hypothetical protein Taro_044439 [Colocasia esculenta]|uniref:Uncharacterized protein n=1 Tax=Colocasia esculenta TaxID=4460 RepID=A0A843X3B3_COLES|nr:hypothetical protein [Colocasia esculenta]
MPASATTSYFPSYGFIPISKQYLSPLGRGTQAIFHEELLSSSRLEDGKKVPSIISHTEENATVDGGDHIPLFHAIRFDTCLCIGGGTIPVITDTLEAYLVSRYLSLHPRLVRSWILQFDNLVTLPMYQPGPALVLGKQLLSVPWSASCAQVLASTLHSPQVVVVKEDKVSTGRVLPSPEGTRGLTPPGDQPASQILFIIKEKYMNNEGNAFKGSPLLLYAQKQTY